MRLAAIRPGDIVLVDRLGRRFYAIVRASVADGLAVEPIDRRVTYRQARAREVIEHYARQNRPRDAPGPGESQLTLEDERRLTAEWDDS